MIEQFELMKLLNVLTFPCLEFHLFRRIKFLLRPLNIFRTVEIFTVIFSIIDIR